MLIDSHVRELITALEQPAANHKTIVNRLLTSLIERLTENCAKSAALARYATLHDTPKNVAEYPVEADGYARSFSPLEDEEAFVACWQRYGIVVGRAVVPPAQCAAARKRIAALVKELSAGACDLTTPTTWTAMPVDTAGVSLLSRGFFEVYHDALLADLRQAVRLYLHHVVIWGRTDLWTSFDRLGVKLPGHAESASLPLHVDQNPNVHPGFRTLQGVLALDDCPLERGTFVGVPGSRGLFGAYSPMARNQGEFVELALENDVARQLQAGAQPLPLRAGDIVSWDSRTTHANSANVSDRTRMVAYIAAGPAPTDPALVDVRRNAFLSGEGSNVREALMHASKKPRYTNPPALARVRQAEHLTVLGEKLYGFTPDDAAAA